jgi:SH3-like domain-containing protein
VTRAQAVVPQIIAGGILLALLASAAGCNHGRGGKGREAVYVSASQVFLRDRVATVFNKVGSARNGERLEVLERTNNRRFVRVRTTTGQEGWVEQRALVSQEVFDGFQKLTQQNSATPAQAPGATRAETNLHLTPGRETDHLYQLAQGEKIAMLRREIAEKVLPGATSKPKVGAAAESAVLEDWWLVRDAQGRSGWLLGRLIDVDAPLEIAQYAEGQRIVAFFPLDEVADGDKKITEYLVLLSEPKDGQPADYSQARVFTWNLRRHRYETAYRERKLAGVLPVTMGRENFPKEGNLPVFTLRVKDAGGQVSERKYKMNRPMVRRVGGIP